MSEPTIADRQAEFEQWYQDWLRSEGPQWEEKTPESLLSYFKLRLCVTLY